MIGRHARFQGCENENLSLLVNLENIPAAIADIQVIVPIESNPGRNTHSLTVSRFFALNRNLVDVLVVPAGDKHLAASVKGDPRRIHKVCHKGLNVPLWINFEYRVGNLFATSPTQRRKDITFTVHGRVGNRVQIRGQYTGNLDVNGRTLLTIHSQSHLSA